MSNNQSSELDLSYRQKLSAEVIMTQVYGTFLSAIADRKVSENLTQRTLADQTGRDETGISKLLAKPGNWTLKTISDLALGLNVEVRLLLVDRKNPARAFSDVGIREFRNHARSLSTPKTGNLFAPAMKTDRTAIKPSLSNVVLLKIDPSPRRENRHEEATLNTNSVSADRNNFYYSHGQGTDE